MGNLCTLSKTHRQNSISYEKEKPETILPIPLTQQDRILLISSWIIVGPKWREICFKAFEGWFATYPELAHSFKIPNYTKGAVKELEESPVLKIHLKKVEKVVQKTIEIVEDNEGFVNSLIQLGKLHYNIGASGKYAMSLANHLLKSLCDTMGPEIDSRTAIAWDTLFRFIITALKRGMRQAEQESLKNEAANALKNTTDEQPIEEQTIEIINGR